MTATFEQGPIRPPSEARSLLVRVTRNCPWNRCAFCPVYKGRDCSARPPAEILADLDEMKAAAERGEFPLAQWLADGGRTVFLQDANAIASPRKKLLAVLEGIRERFPTVDRITTYSQTRTLARKPVELLTAYREAGLSRVHVGLETGSDAVLELVDKGATAAVHIEGGRRVVTSGLHLCCYVMPGLGGVALSEDHAAETARVLTAIQPAAVRLRSLVVAPRTPLGELVAAGRFDPLSEAAMVAEIRAMLAAMDGVHARLVSDHDLNLLPELEGQLPGDLPRLLAICDTFLGWGEADRNRFVFGRRARLVGSVADLGVAGVRDAIDDAAARFGVDLLLPIDEWMQQLRRQMV